MLSAAVKAAWFAADGSQRRRGQIFRVFPVQHAQGVQTQPRKLLSGIPGLEVAEIPEGSLCCGSAGVYNLLQSETANQLGDRKVENLLTTGAEAVLSANPGCLLQLMNGLRRRGLKAMPAFHMVELLDASIRGIPAAELLRGDKAPPVVANWKT